MILFWLLLFLSIIYITVVLGSTYLWSSQTTERGEHPTAKVSVVVIARNEAKNIGDCLTSIASNDYPRELYEILLVDDHSEDKTVQIAESLGIVNLRILCLKDFDLSRYKNAFKKAAQYHAVKMAQHDVILQTDADCICPPHWIQLMVSAMDRNDIVAGPVHILGSDTMLSKWQSFENIGTIVGTAAGIASKKWYSANAANMAYRKSLFVEYSNTAPVKGASGDDIYLINWAIRNSKKVTFYKSKKVIVTTPAEETLSALINQRKRWASKTTSYQTNGLKMLMTTVFLYHFLLILSIFYFVSLGVVGIRCLFILFLIKWIADYILLRSSALFFNMKYPLLLSPIFSGFHAIYIAFMGMMGLFTTTYSWKGRMVS